MKNIYFVFFIYLYKKKKKKKYFKRIKEFFNKMRMRRYNMKR
jgi:hypothetical protein